MSILRPATVESLRSFAELENVREFWAANCNHRDADLAFYSTVTSSIPGATPYVMRLHRNGLTEALMVGRIEQGTIVVRAGYFRIPTPRLRMLNLIHGCMIGSFDDEHSEAAVSFIGAILRRREVDVVCLHDVDIESLFFRHLDRLLGPLTRGRSLISSSHWYRRLYSTEARSATLGSACGPSSKLSFLDTMSAKQRSKSSPV